LLSVALIAGKPTFENENKLHELALFRTMMAKWHKKKLPKQLFYTFL